MSWPAWCDRLSLYPGDVVLAARLACTCLVWRLPSVLAHGTPASERNPCTKIASSALPSFLPNPVPLSAISVKSDWAGDMLLYNLLKFKITCLIGLHIAQNIDLARLHHLFDCLFWT